MNGSNCSTYNKLLNPFFYIMPLDRRKANNCSRKMQALVCWTMLFLIFFSLPYSVKAQTLLDNNCPSQCTCSFAKKLVNCSNRSLKRIPQLIPPWVSVLTFRNNKIDGSQINGYIFNNLTNLQELIFSDNHLTLMNLNIHNLPKLRTLRFDRCSLHQLPNISANIASNVTTLTLSHNSIQEIGRRLKQWPSLKILDLSFNKLRHIKNGTFIQQKSLIELYLHRNKISRIDSCAFDGLNESLLTLSLNRNRIRVPPRLSSSSILEPCAALSSNIEFLDLSRNHITQITSLVFNGMCGLKTLLLNDNRISTLNDGSFYSLRALVTLNLDNNIIREVSNPWLFDLESLEKLSLTNNNVSRISPESWKFCKEPKYMNLSYNNLSVISKGLFRYLSKLQVLDLSNNRIEVMENDAFVDLPNLLVLNLSRNRISSSVEDIDGAFHGLSSLQTLLLHDNKIRSLSSEVLGGAHNIRLLDLRRNNVTSVENSTFAASKNLSNLFLDSTSFLCDCQLSWFTSWIRDKISQGNLSFTGNPVCFHPSPMKGRSILEIDPYELECGEKPDPALLQQPSYLSSYRGENVTLECSASATLTGGHSDEELSKVDMTVVWKRGPVDGAINPNAVISESKSIRIRNQHRRDSGHIFFTSLLLLYGVTYSDEQMYSCVISNKFGHAESMPARLRVFDLPEITKKPQDRVVQEGDYVIFDCQAMGHPLPDISWEKDGGRTMHAAKEERVIHRHGAPSVSSSSRSSSGGEQTDVDSESGNVSVKDFLLERGGGLSSEAATGAQPKVRNVIEVPLHITDVKARDAGVYSCIANSEVGRRRADATLTVMYAPVVEPMNKQIRAAVGSNVVFKCMSHAHPTPVIMWFKDDGPLNTTERHFFAGRKQLLVVSDVREADQGSYACAVSNNMGTRRSETNLVLGSDDSWDLLGTKGIVILSIFTCIILTSLVWLIVLCYSRKHPEAALSTQTAFDRTERTFLDDQADAIPFDSSSRDSLDRNTNRSCMLVRRTDGNMSGHFDQFPPDLLPTATFRQPMPSTSQHRSEIAISETISRSHKQTFRRQPSMCHSTRNDTVYTRTPLHRPPLRAHSTSHMNHMSVDCGSVAFQPPYSSMHCLPLDSERTELRSQKTLASKKKRRRRRQAVQPDEENQKFSRRSVSPSSDSESCREGQSLMSDRTNNSVVWKKRTRNDQQQLPCRSRSITSSQSTVLLNERNIKHPNGMPDSPSMKTNGT